MAIDFRKIVKQAMKTKGWTAYRLAKESGVDENSVRFWLNKRNDTSTAKLALMLEALGITIQLPS